jgi:hypothetical protein
MKRAFPVFLVLVLLSGAFFLSSCKGKVSTFGTLSVTARTKDTISTGTPVRICLASSKENLENKIYLFANWSDANFSTIFRDLEPTYYWYRVEGWADYGAAEVFAGVDASVVIWLNTPEKAKNK